MATARLDTAGIVEDGKNLKQIVCPRCGSKILPPKMGSYEVDNFLADILNVLLHRKQNLSYSQ